MVIMLVVNNLMQMEQQYVLQGGQKPEGLLLGRGVASPTNSVQNLDLIFLIFVIFSALSSTDRNLHPRTACLGQTIFCDAF